MVNPRVSVIVATYNWSAAVRCALTAIQNQSYAAFEVLIIGDGCTDDTADVVRSFHDPRFAFHNMPKNHGNQWAPNNYGLHIAKGELVAYCAHDDIWHPDHLSALLATIDAHDGSAAVSGLLMYGPPGTSLIHVAGVFPSSTMEEGHFVPASAFMHRQDLVFDIGWWADANLIALPADYEFQSRVMRHGPIYTTGTVTVFKFNAASRRDSYKTKRVSEQEAILAAIANDRDFRQDELLKTLKCFSEGKLHKIGVPDMRGSTGSEISRRTRRYKGLDAYFAPSELRRLDDKILFSLDHIEPSYEWHGTETLHGRNFRWTGPLTTSIVDLPLMVDQPATISIHIILAADDVLYAGLSVMVNGTGRSHVIDIRDDGSAVVKIDIGVLETPLRIAIEVPHTQPAGSADRREVGLAVAWIEVAPRRVQLEGEDRETTAEAVS